MKHGKWLNPFFKGFSSYEDPQDHGCFNTKHDQLLDENWGLAATPHDLENLSNHFLSLSENSKNHHSMHHRIRKILRFQAYGTSASG